MAPMAADFTPDNVEGEQFAFQFPSPYARVLPRYSPLLRTKFTEWSNFVHGQRREGTASAVPNSAPAGRVGQVARVPGVRKKR